MQRLWAPWRMEYINGDREGGCIFCAKPEREEDAANHILHRGEHSFIMLNAFPYTNGHLLVAPYRHLADPLELTPEEQADLLGSIGVALSVLRRALHPQGLNVGLNLGTAAGAGLADHIHVHIVPRWEGDTNFMTVLGQVRVIPEALDRTYARLRQALCELDAERGRAQG